MKTLYLECNMGAAGDMLMAALMEICPDPAGFIDKMNNIGLQDTVVKAVKADKYGITGHQIDVLIRGMFEEDVPPLDESHHHDNNEHEHCHHGNNEHEHHHHDTGEHRHTGLSDIRTLIAALAIPAPVKEKAVAVYTILAEAEAHVHGCPVGDIHFHEVGTLDAVADIVGCCLALELIAPDRVIVSPIHVGSGQIKCQHGILPVPAPATAYLLREAPVYSGDIRGELCTPTGAALLQAFAHSYGAMPVMKLHKIGYGMGKKDFGCVSCVRAFLGDEDDAVKAAGIVGDEIRNETAEAPIYEISCNLDDITAEELAFACEQILAAGALDVFAVPTVMKKGRAGHLLTALAAPDHKDAVALSVLTHTTTRGLRFKLCARMTMTSRFEAVQTPYGDIVLKRSSGYGLTRVKPEYECVAAAARKHHVTFHEVYDAAMNAYRNRA